MSLVADFDFDLPDDLIAQDARPRGESRLLIVDRARQIWHETTMREFPAWLKAGDLVVANDTRVFPARLIGERQPSGGRAECFLVERVGDTSTDAWLALVKPGARIQPGARILCVDETRAPGVRLTIVVRDREPFGRRRVELSADGARSVDAAIDALGHMPLPPYIRRADSDADRERYQTVYANARGSIAAPTAGLHFDASLIKAVRDAGASWASITLHVGYGTFKPVRVEAVDDHQVDAERFVVSDEAAQSIAATRAAGKRVIAVGTTTTRALETAGRTGQIVAGEGSTDLFVRPGHEFTVVDALLTNFHLPKSSLLMLVSAFGGRDLVLAAYRHAVSARFRFYSYGDAMLLI